MGIEPGESIRDLCGLLESSGIKVYPIRIASNDFFGLSVAPQDGGPAVVVNIWERISVERWIFSAVHELGHLLLHLDSFNVELEKENPEEEKEADLFAAHFLMPEEVFIKEWEEAKGLSLFDRVM
jgi:Zn-dependent peptidase ImmA (M78 family)